MYDQNSPFSLDHRFLNTVINTIEEGVVVQNSLGKFISCNKKACELLEVTPEELLNNTLANDSVKIYDEDGQLIPFEKNPVFITLTTSEPQRNITVGVPLKGDQLKWFSVNTHIMFIEEEKYVISAFSNITKLIDLNKGLHEQNKALLQTHAELEKKITQLKDFAGIITHDVRGPANNIKKLLDIYETNKGAESGQRAFLHLKNASADLINNLNELIKLSQWHLDKQMPFSPCHFDMVADSVLLQLENIIQQKKAVIHRRFKISSFEYAKVYLHSILYNLISNALKYAQSDIPVEIILESFEEDGRVCLRVSDNGKGIDLSKFGNVVFQFQRSFHNETDSKGIGLYLIKHQVEELGGSIHVASEVNKGTIFTIIF